MAILFTEGFEHYRSTSTSRYMTIDTRWLVTNLGYYDYVTGNNSSKALEFSSSNSTLNSLGQVVNLQSFAAGMDIQAPSNNTGYMNVFRFESPNGSWISLRLRGTHTVSPYGQVEFVVNNTVYTCDYTVPVIPGTWFFLELQVEYLGSNKVNVIARQDGRIIAELLDITAWTGGENKWSRFWLGKTDGSNYSSTFRCDNLYITDGELLGPLEINTILPSADTAQKQWSPSSGAINYNRINQAQSQFDSSYVVATQPSKDIYELTDFTLPADKVIVGVVPYMFAHGSPTGNSPLRYVLKNSAGNEAASSNFIPPNRNIKYYGGSILTLNPFTGQKWTATDLTQLKAGPEWPSS